MVERCQAWHAIIAFGQHRGSDDVRRCMPSSPLSSTHSQMTSGVACHHRLWGAHRIDRCRALHAIIAFGKHTRSTDVGRGIPSSPYGSTHGRTTSDVTCHHHIWTTHTVGLRRAWNDITTFGHHTRSNNVEHGMPSIAFGQHKRLDYVGRGMTSPLLDSIHGRTTSAMACHHRPWAAHTVRLHRAWHNISALRQHARSNDVGRGMPSSPLG